MAELSDDIARGILIKTGIKHIELIFDECLADAYEDAEINVQILRLLADQAATIEQLRGALKDDSPVVEPLAAYAHEAWSGWMFYLFHKSQKNPDGTVTIPKWAVDRWDSQARTVYDDLSEDMKLSDRKEARKMLGIIRNALDGKE